MQERRTTWSLKSNILLHNKQLFHLSQSFVELVPSNSLFSQKLSNEKWKSKRKIKKSESLDSAFFLLECFTFQEYFPVNFLIIFFRIEILMLRKTVLLINFSFFEYKKLYERDLNNLFSFQHFCDLLQYLTFSFFFMKTFLFFGDRFDFLISLFSKKNPFF